MKHRLGNTAFALAFMAYMFGLSPVAVCFSMPHITHGAVAAVMALLVIIMAGLISLGDATPNPVSQHWMCAAHSQVEQKAFLFKTVIVLSANLLSGHWQAQASIILVAAGWLAYVYVRWVSNTSLLVTNVMLAGFAALLDL